MARGFLSYAHHDNEDYQVSYLRRHLESELRVLLRDDQFTVFQDEQISIGVPWKDRVMRALRTSDVFIAICTKSYFASNECREELDAFLKYTMREGRDNRIFPVFYDETTEAE